MPGHIRDNSEVRRMVMAGVLALAAASSAATAQAQGGYGYVFAAPGAVHAWGDSDGTLQVGGGGGFVTPSGVGLDFEIGFLGPWEHFSREGLGVLSIDGSYHFGARAAKWRPFIEGGYSLFFREEQTHLWNLGFGVHYWVRDTTAFRLEVRDHLDNRHRETAHVWGVRFGATFRFTSS
jgi:hypothetical protein